MPVVGSHKSIQVGLQQEAIPVQGRIMELDPRLLEFSSILQHYSEHCPAAWDLFSCSGRCLASLQSSQFSFLAELCPPSNSSRCPRKPQERYEHHKAPNPPVKPQPEMSHVSHWLQLSEKLFSCRNVLLANPLRLQSLYVCKILQKETSRAQSSTKTFGSATHLSLGVLSKCFKCLFKLCFFFHQIFTLILTVLKTLFLLANFILQLFKLGRETKVLKCT